MSRSIPALLTVAVLMASPSLARAQNKPFPQGAGYGRGYLPHHLTAADVRRSYDGWKHHYLLGDCGGGYQRVEFNAPRGTTVSEGMGYGMILTVYLGDRDAFDGLWKFVRKNEDHDGLMGWKVSCTGFISAEGGEGSATDGDTDIGLALVAAVDQWGDAYRQTALDYLATLKRVDFTTCTPTGRVMAKGGNWGGGCDKSNTSYFMPGFYRVFRDFTHDDFWGKAADDAVALWLLDRNPRTGLDANEIDQNGVTVGPAVVDYNGCRIPWRAVTDYLWNGTPGAKDVADRTTAWASSVGISRLVDGYNVDGTPSAAGKWPQLNPWVGAWAAGAMASSQDVLDTFADDFKSIPDDNGGYYGASLRTLYLLTLTGNFWKPGTPPAPARHADVADAPPPVPARATSCGCTCAGAPAEGPVTAALGIALLGLRRKRRTRS